MVNLRMIENAFQMTLDDYGPEDVENVNKEEIGVISKRFSAILNELAKDAPSPEEDLEE